MSAQRIILAMLAALVMVNVIVFGPWGLLMVPLLLAAFIAGGISERRA